MLERFTLDCNKQGMRWTRWMLCEADLLGTVVQGLRWVHTVSWRDVLGAVVHLLRWMHVLGWIDLLETVVHGLCYVDACHERE